MRFLSSLKRSGLLKTAAVVAFAALPGAAMAADSWVDVFKNASETLNALKVLIVIAAYLVGTTLGVLGLWLIYKDGKEENRGHMKNGVISLVIGALLLIFPTTIGWTVGTLGADNGAMEKEIEADF